MKVGLIVEAGDVREVHHAALLVGYGASAINPYLAMETAEQLVAVGHDHRDHDREGRQEPHQGARQGRAQDHVEDGHLGRRLVRGGPGVRGHRPQPGVRRPVLHRHDQPARRRRHRRHRRRERRPARRRVPEGRRDPRARAPAGRRRVPVAARRTAAPVQPRHRVPAPALHPRPPLRHLPRLHAARRRAGREPADPARPVQAAQRHPSGRADRRGRVGRVDHHAVQHRRDELRLDQQGGARDPRDRDEPPRRAQQHGRGRRGRRTSHRPRAPQRDQAGRERALRRHEHVPDARDRHPDQDGAGREARRGRPAARQQGLPVDRAHPARHRGRRPDLAAAAPRHLLDRRPQAADLRPQAREPRGARARQAGQPVGHRRGRRRRHEGARRRRAGLRSRRRNRRRARSTRSSTRERPGRSAWPRPSRRSCSTGCATASSCRSTVR